MKQRRELDGFLAVTLVLLVAAGFLWKLHTPRATFFDRDWNHFLGNLFVWAMDALVLWIIYQIGRWQQRRDHEMLTPIDERKPTEPSANRGSTP